MSLSFINKAYRLIGLVESHSLTLDISKEDFIRLLKPRVGTDSNSSLDMFSSGKIDYKGVVGSTGFYLRRKRGWANNTRHFCKVYGTFLEEDPLVIDLEFKNFPPAVYFFLIFALFFGLGSIVMLLAALLSFSYERIVIGISNVGSVAVFVFIIGFIVRNVSSNTITKMRYELENNIQRYITTKA